jgi:hypothetical protein
LTRAVDRAGSGRDRSREPLVKLAVAENPATGELIRQLLQDAGVPSLVKNTDALGVLIGSLWTSPFAMQIFVLSGDEAAAHEALAAAGFDPSRTLALPARSRPRRRRRKVLRPPQRS